ncbi:hypothetical protein B0H14DRAFT_2590510 [Mycena olivaceomarginata]|nr:hypothetical protein B0H14DRAFT_2590510 [Mycena olivaceomarginata]
MCRRVPRVRAPSRGGQGAPCAGGEHRTNAQGYDAWAGCKDNLEVDWGDLASEKDMGGGVENEGGWRVIWARSTSSGTKGKLEERWNGHWACDDRDSGNGAFQPRGGRGLGSGSAGADLSMLANSIACSLFVEHEERGSEPGFSEWREAHNCPHHQCIGNFKRDKYLTIPRNEVARLNCWEELLSRENGRLKPADGSEKELPDYCGQPNSETILPHIVRDGSTVGVT